MSEESQNTLFFRDLCVIQGPVEDEEIKMSSRKELLINCGHFSEKLYETHNQYENTTTREFSCLEFLSNIQLSHLEHQIHHETHKDKRWILSKNKITYGPPCIKCGCKNNVSGDGDIYCRCDTCSKTGCKYDKGITLPDISKELSELEDISLKTNHIFDTMISSMNGKEISILRSVSKTFYVLLHTNEKVLDLIWNKRSDELCLFQIKQNCKCCHCRRPDEQGWKEVFLYHYMDADDGCLQSYDSRSCCPCPECSYAVETWSNEPYGGGDTQVYCMKCYE